MNFCKMHGLKNDFVVIENMQRQHGLTKEQIMFLCNRKEGIGADGLILIEPSLCADVRMKYFNSDGSIAQVCGNGLRCVAKYVYDKKLIANSQMRIESEGRGYDIVIKALDEQKEAKTIRVNMGKACFESAKIPVETGDTTALNITTEIAGESMSLSAVAFPNPHAILIAESWDEKTMQRIGAALQQHALFLQQVNANFVIVKSRGEVELTTYERGVGITEACGSGACATAAVLYKNNIVDAKVLVKMPGGTLKINIDSNEDVFMTGEAVTVFAGTI